MRNLQKGFTGLVLTVVVGLLVIGGGVYLYKFHKNPVEQSESEALATAREVITALTDRNYQKLEALVSPDGLSLSMHIYEIDLKKNLIPKDEISDISSNTKIYLWGYTDGKGDPVNRTRAQFLAERFDSKIDYWAAPEISVNKRLPAYRAETGSGPVFEEDIQGRTFVAFYFPGKEHPNAWRTLYLIFDSIDGDYKLRGITEDYWTI